MFDVPENQTLSPAVDGKVVVLCGSFPPMPCGVGDSAFELASELARKGLDIEVLCDVQADGVEKGEGPFPVHNVIKNWGLTGTRRIVHEIENLKPDILHIHYPSKAYGRGVGVPFVPLFIRSRRRKFKIVLTLHEFRLAHTLRKQASFLLLNPADAVVMPCPLELEALTRRHVSVTEKYNEAIPVGPVGPSPDDYTPDEKIRLRKKIRDEWGVNDDDVVLLHYGTPTASKGLEVLFKALRILMLEGVTPTLVIAGDHRPQENDFHRLLASQPRGLGIHSQVKWLGRRPTEDLPGIFLAADVGVFPFFDGFSFRRSSLVSVLRWDIPIITTKPAGYLPEIEDQEKVRFVNRNDQKSLATGLITLIANPRALEIAREAPNPLMDYFRWPSIAEKYIDVYRDVLDMT